MKARKFQPGEVIESWNELMIELRAGRWVYLKHKVLHPGWVWSMQTRALDSYVSGRSVRKAVKL